MQNTLMGFTLKIMGGGSRGWSGVAKGRKIPMPPNRALLYYWNSTLAETSRDEIQDGLSGSPPFYLNTSFPPPGLLQLFSPQNPQPSNSPPHPRPRPPHPLLEHPSHLTITFYPSDISNFFSPNLVPSHIGPLLHQVINPHLLSSTSHVYNTSLLT